MTVTPALAAAAIYSGLNALILIWLAFGVGRLRGELGILVGDGGNARLIRAMRGQANFVETVPMALILIALSAALGAPAWVIHLLGIALTAARILHGLHFLAADAPAWQRSVGAAVTLFALLLAALGAIGHGLARLL
jgi:hypothetical protein